MDLNLSIYTDILPCLTKLLISWEIDPKEFLSSILANTKFYCAASLYALLVFKHGLLDTRGIVKEAF